MKKDLSSIKKFNPLKMESILWLSSQQATNMDFTMAKISTLCASNQHLIVGNRQGEVLAMDLRTGKNIYKIPSHSSTAINHISLDGTLLENFFINNFLENDSLLLVSDDTGSMHCYDLQEQKLGQSYQFQSSVNCSRVMPHGDIILSVGNFPQVHISDRRSGKVEISKSEFTGASYSASWHPNGIHFAVGNENYCTK